jgi:hypothetical protein
MTAATTTTTTTTTPILSTKPPKFSHTVTSKCPSMTLRYKSVLLERLSVKTVTKNWISQILALNFQWVTHQLCVKQYVSLLAV